MHGMRTPVECYVIYIADSILGIFHVGDNRICVLCPLQCPEFWDLYLYCASHYYNKVYFLCSSEIGICFLKSQCVS
jgi:hypothetical protein